MCEAAAGWRFSVTENICASFVGSVLNTSAPVYAQNNNGSLAALDAYNGADRDQRLRAGARAERTVVWYTLLIRITVA
jgi:hypothetical protein